MAADAGLTFRFSLMQTSFVMAGRTLGLLSAFQEDFLMEKTRGVLEYAFMMVNGSAEHLVRGKNFREGRTLRIIYDNRSLGRKRSNRYDPTTNTFI